MGFVSSLSIINEYLAGEFENKLQAIADPAWYVNLRMWHRPLNLFPGDNITLFAEQANILKINQPYRQRLLQVTPSKADGLYKVQYYMFKNPALWRGAGSDYTILEALTPEKLDVLPGCVLTMKVETLPSNEYKLIAKPIPDTRCTFDYAGNTVEVSLGFEATRTEFFSYDKGIDPTTRKATWGAILGPYRYTKLQQF